MSAPEYVKGGKKKVLSAAERAQMLGEPVPNIKAKSEAAPDLGEINFQCKWKDSEKQERYDRYCKNLKEGKSEPYAGLAPDDYG